MTTSIKTINLGGVNCYLVSAGASFILIDTGIAGKHGQLLKEMESAGCNPDMLKLIVLTHGDIDHATNAAFLCHAFGTKIAMHPDDAGMVENGNMGWNRKSKPDQISFIGGLIILLGSIAPFFDPSQKFEKFNPDVLVEDGRALNEYGLDASVIDLPGHSKGSIGVLTSNGDFFCGDLLWNLGIPGRHFFVDDLAAHTTSLQKLKDKNVKFLYPGHKHPFSMENFHIERIVK